MSLLHSLLTLPLKAILNNLSKKRLPPVDGEISLSGLKGDKVTVIRDRWGVPHIYAANPHDAFFGQGFVHAQDRLFQMEVARRLASGKLSEIFGEMALETDRMVRTFGFPRLAREDWSAISEDLSTVIIAYAKGVNAFIRKMEPYREVSFSLLRLEPEEWKPEDTLAIMRLMVWELSHGWQGELVRGELAEAVGEEHAADWEIHYPENNPLTLPDGIEFNALDPDGKLHRARGPFLMRNQGSNTWVISAERSATGSVVLANDMHLKVGVPNVWYENHLIAGDLNVTGVSIPGLPTVQVGHNAHIAWGMTLAYTDAEDLFVERFDPQSPSRYLFKGEWREAEEVTELITVKGKSEPISEKVIITHHGPVISAVLNYGPKMQETAEFVERLAVQSMALQPAEIIRGWWLLNRAANWDEFVEAMRWISAPQLSVSYADVEGNIGYWMTGKIPVRAKGDGRFPVPGWTGEYEWVGEVPFEEMPHALNPKRGYIINTNNKVVGDDYPHYLGSIWMNGYRSRRLEELINAKEKLTLDDHAAMQTDVTSLPGKEFVEAIGDFQSDDPDVALALRLLREWDFKLTPDSVGGSVYEVARYTLVRELLLSAVDEELAYRIMGKGFHPLTLYTSEFYGYDTVSLLRFLRSPDNWWVKRAGGREKWLSRSLKQAIGWLRENYGNNPKNWEWGKLHELPLVHLIGVQPPLDKIFNPPPLRIGGDSDTPCQTGVVPDAPYKATSFAPSHRAIIDLKDWDNSRIVILGGQSGRLASPHYADMVPLWYEKRHHPMLWSREAIEAQAEGKLILTVS